MSKFDVSHIVETIIYFLLGRTNGGEFLGLQQDRKIPEIKSSVIHCCVGFANRKSRFSDLTQG